MLLLPLVPTVKHGADGQKMERKTQQQKSGGGGGGEVRRVGHGVT